MIVSGNGLTAAVDVQRGGKITSLVDRSGTEWLAQAAPGESRETGRAFIDSEMCGWDECAPSINACTVDGRAIPDHGDLWDQPFSQEHNRVHTVGRSLDYDFERTIEATESGLRFNYAATARTRQIPFLWAAHPQFLAPAGTRVEVPGLVSVVDVLADRPERAAWTDALATIDTIDAGGCRKVYADPEHPFTNAALVRPNGSRLHLSWSLATPYLGIWFDNAAFSREPVIAIEPSTGYFDSLETAIHNNRVPTLTPNQSFRWHVDLAVVA